MAIPFHLRPLNFSLSNPANLTAEEICLATFHPEATDYFLASLYKHWSKKREGIGSAGGMLEMSGIVGLAIDFPLDDLNSLSSEQLAIVAAGFHLNVEEDDKETLKAQRLFLKRRERDLAKETTSTTARPQFIEPLEEVVKDIDDVKPSVFIKASPDSPVPAIITPPPVSPKPSTTFPAAPAFPANSNPFGFPTLQPFPSISTSKTPSTSPWQAFPTAPSANDSPFKSLTKPFASAIDAEILSPSQSHLDNPSVIQDDRYFTLILEFNQRCPSLWNFNRRLIIISSLLSSNSLAALRIDEQCNSPFKIAIGFRGPSRREKAAIQLNEFAWMTRPKICFIDKGRFEWEEADIELARERPEMKYRGRRDPQGAAELKRRKEADARTTEAVIQAGIAKGTRPQLTPKTGQKIHSVVPPNLVKPNFIPLISSASAFPLNITSLPTIKVESPSSTCKSKPSFISSSNNRPRASDFFAHSSYHPAQEMITDFDPKRDDLGRILPHGWSRSPRLFYFHQDERDSIWTSPLDIETIEDTRRLGSGDGERNYNHQISEGPRSAGAEFDSPPLRYFQVTENPASNKRGLQGSDEFLEGVQKRFKGF